MIAILQSIIILLISAERFLHKYKQKWIEKDAHLDPAGRGSSVEGGSEA